MSFVNFKKSSCPPVAILVVMSIFLNPSVVCRIQEMTHVVSLILILMLLGSMLLVSFKKSPCHCVEFRGQGHHTPSHLHSGVHHLPSLTGGTTF